MKEKIFQENQIYKKNTWNDINGYPVVNVIILNRMFLVQ